MVSILQVYNALKDLANKEQKGFITPQVFNNFASLAQMNIYNEMFTELSNAKRLSRQNFDPGRDKSFRKQKLEDLAFYIKRTEIDAADNDGSVFGTTGTLTTVQKPSDLSKIISIMADSNITSEGDEPTENFVQCQLVYEPEKMNYILSSNLSSPTANNPVALVSRNYIEVFPDTLDYVEITYYSKPGSINSSGNVVNLPPIYAYNSSNFGGSEVEFFDSNNSRDFHLPPHYLTEVVMEMAKLIGVRLRDPNITQFAAQEEAAE
jgi:hypothetical protein